MSREKYTLGDLSISIQPGPFGSQLHSSDYAETGVPIVMPKDMKDGKILHSGLLKVPEEHAKRLSRHKVHAGNLMIARKGDVRKCILVTDYEDGWMTGSDCLKVVLDTEKCYPPFIYYQLRSPYIGRWMEMISIGATMPSLNTRLLSSIEISLPNYVTQVHRSNFLVAYDKLIENNQKQIKLLEEAAQRLYKEWFVDLRFPGYEDVEIVDGVPEGWEKVNLDIIAPILTGKKDANFGTDDGAYPFFTCAQEPIKAPSYSFDCDAVILAGNGDFNVKLYRGQFEAYQRTYVFSPKDPENLYLLYYAVKDSMRQLFQGASGSTIKFLTKRMLVEILVFVPTNEIKEQFNAVCESYQRKIEALKLQIQFATEARDRLLPKLMSGKLEV